VGDGIGALLYLQAVGLPGFLGWRHLRKGQ
jgi:hypothetical protein